MMKVIIMMMVNKYDKFGTSFGAPLSDTFFFGLIEIDRYFGFFSDIDRDLSIILVPEMTLF